MGDSSKRRSQVLERRPNAKNGVRVLAQLSYNAKRQRTAHRAASLEGYRSVPVYCTDLPVKSFFFFSFLFPQFNLLATIHHECLFFSFCFVLLFLDPTLVIILGACVLHQLTYQWYNFFYEMNIFLLPTMFTKGFFSY